MHAPCYLELNSTFAPVRAHEIKAALAVPGAAPTGPGPQFPKQKRGAASRQRQQTQKPRPERSKPQVLPGLWPQKRLPAPLRVPGFTDTPGSRNRRRCFCSAPRISVPRTGSDLCCYLRYQKHVLQFHPSAQGGLQVYKRSWILSTTMDLFLFK